MPDDKRLPGRILALDLGEKRIGVALSDATRTVARSHSVIQRRSRREDFESLSRIAREEGATLILVGLPVGLAADGSPLADESPKVQWMRDYAQSFGETVSLPVRFWDESFSTVAATGSLQERGRRGRRGRERIDAVAAAIILQSFLDSGQESGALTGGMP